MPGQLALRQRHEGSLNSDQNSPRVSRPFSLKVGGGRVRRLPKRLAVGLRYVAGMRGKRADQLHGQIGPFDFQRLRAVESINAIALGQFKELSVAQPSDECRVEGLATRWRDKEDGKAGRQQPR